MNLLKIYNKICQKRFALNILKCYNIRYRGIMKRNLIILISALLIVCVFAVYFVINYRNMQIDVQANNKEYITYKDKTIVGTTLVSLINKTVDNNEKNNISKDEKNTYIENDKNSVKIYIYFLDIEKEDKYIETPYTMEQIYNNDTENFIKLYGTSNFYCTKIDYHEKTGNIKSLTFEQQIY